MEVGTQRRLAAIVAVDVVGYSRLMGADETGTLSVLRSHRMDLIDPLIARHDGRIVKTLGDGLLLEFPSVVAAVTFAIAMQEGVTARNAEIPEDKAMRFRVGVHLGDVIIEDDDIFGDGVNVAARIEALAEPDGICLSDDAYHQVRDRIEADWRDGGEQQAKNIARPLQVWHWRRAAVHSPERPAGADAAPDLPDKPSVAVLPFDNMSGDPEQEFFADGMTEDLITDLSKVSGLFVVARNSSFVFKGQAVDIREAARRLGVRYVVEGSVRKVGQRVRINVQLIDAGSGGHLWAERYDGTVDNVFELQDDVGAKVVSALSVRLRGDEGDRLRQVHTHNLDAYELYVRARATPFPPLPERIDAAEALFAQVIEMDPDFAGGYAGLAWMICLRATFGASDPREAAARALEMARKAMEVDESFGWSNVALGLALVLDGRHDEAIAAIDEAVALQPNDADVHAFRGLFLALSGRAELALEPIERALRLNPQFVQGPYLNFLCIINLLRGAYADAAEAFERNVARHGPVGPPALSWVAAAYQLLGRGEDARRIADRLAAQFPAYRVREANFLKLIRPPEKREELLAAMLEAGLAE